LTGAEITLCFPDGEKSCFGCCPPIRPSGYDHLDYRSIISRMLLDNTKAYNPYRPDIRPITGFSCWAMGYLDKRYRTVGCLLHPCRNGGIDLRHRVDFAEKCRRETCEEAKVFARLSCPTRSALLGLAKGMDSFTYSSRKANPIFGILMWGAPLLEAVANEPGDGEINLSVRLPDMRREAVGSESEKGSDDTPAVSYPGKNRTAFESWVGFTQAYPFFASSISPRTHAYIVTSIVQRLGTGFLKKTDACKVVEELSAEAHSMTRKASAEESGNQTWTHLLDLPGSFLDYLRLGAGMAKISLERAVELKDMLDTMIDGFVKSRKYHFPSFRRKPESSIFGQL
jgi:hypothetical protein